ncbi:hypothetical protein PENARI_c336G04637, partial [Penicillium arizonense]
MFHLSRYFHGRLAGSQEKAATRTRARHERFLSKRQHDWIGCDDFALSPIDVTRSGNFKSTMEAQQVACRNIYSLPCIVE